MFLKKLINRVEKLKDKKNTINSTCLRVWLWLFFKVFFMPKCIKMMFFYFLKIIFEISQLKKFKI
jgi:hypothetical protein